MRFIDFERGPPLELIDVASEEEYRDFVPRGMAPYSPGINLVLPTGSGRTLADFQEEFAELRPYTLHVNYDGTSDPGKPGWNYLNFEVPLIPDVFVWLTQLDEPRPALTRVVKHANGARELRGLWFDLAEKALERLTRLVGGKVVRGALQIGGLTLWTSGSVEDKPVIRGKRFPLLAVVLDADRVDSGELQDDRVVRGSFQSHPAVQIETGPLSWDIVM